MSDEERVSNDEEEILEEQEEAEEEEKDDDVQNEVSGWADAMSRILGSKKPQKKKQLILSRAKKDYEVRKPKVQVEGIEIVEEEGGSASASSSGKKEEAPENDAQAKAKKDKKAAKKAKKRKANENTAAAEGEEEEEVKDHLSLKKQHKLELKQKRMHKQWENLNRTKPIPAKDREGERELMKIATKGVVELFNAVNLQKKELGKKLRTTKKSEFKRDKVLAETRDLFEDALETVTKKKRKSNKTE